jgi:hypothetical protein
VEIEIFLAEGWLEDLDTLDRSFFSLYGNFVNSSDNVSSDLCFFISILCKFLIVADLLCVDCRFF